MTKNTSRLYFIWYNMKRRCSVPTNKDFHYYGAKGISVCREWIADYAAFRDWAHVNGYEDNLTLDRKDTGGNYEPDNCHWTTRLRQSRNRNDTFKVEYQGTMVSVRDLADEKGISFDTLRGRFRKGWSVERALDPHGVRRVHVRYQSHGKLLRRWILTMRADKKDIYLGCFFTEEEAKEAGEKALLERGENHPS